ncbi:FecCD family ABC transporter permease [Pelagibacterium limicola]|uniref:FecCD family ABC transporter permease n=1 Tax=Pelagibacterium limicola TaxID=2791022 RepID=UPI0018AFF1A1|nr:iron ABC transporter permease [Pelagibacterium limicola]
MTDATLGPAQSRRPFGISATALVFAGMGAFTLLNIVIAICVGRYGVPVGRALEIVAHATLNPGAELSEIDERIVWLVRTPRVLLAALCGAGLAVSGAALQGVFRNPLVSPQVLGISQGAAFGGALAISLGIWGAPLLIMVFLFGLSALAMVGFIARIDGRTEIITVILSGMVVGALFSAFVSLLQYFADPNSSLPAIVYWLMGSFATATWERVGIAAPGMAIGVFLLWSLRFRLNILSLDDAEARSLGARPDLERWIIFVLVALVVGSQVAVSGVVGWIGLVIPHACRLMVGYDHRKLIPASIIAGAGYMVLIDTLARTMTTAEIPLGVLTAIVGAPVFALLLRHHYREKGSK